MYRLTSAFSWTTSLIFDIIFSHYLLAASGVSPGHAIRDLKALDPQASISTPSKDHDSFDPDNQKFLRNMQQRGRQVMIAESLARANRDFDTFLEEKVDLDWEEQRRKIFQHFGLAQNYDSTSDNMGATTRGSAGRSTRASRPGGSILSPGRPVGSRRSVFGRSGLEKSVIGTPAAGFARTQIFEDPAERNEGSAINAPDVRFLREKMGHYADRVQLLNAARLQAHTFPVLHEFSGVEQHTGGDVSHDT